MRIFKYQIDIAHRLNEDTIVHLPRGATVLHVASQNQDLNFQLWALVDPNAPLEPRRFRCYGTGHEIDMDVKMKHAGSTLTEGGSFVFHLFEVLGG